MITEDYVSFENAKLLKEKGFKEWCSQCYGFDVRHNGEPIDVDEEYALRDSGRENEIKYVDGGRMYDYGCGNFNPGSPYAAPTLWIAMKWLREVKHIPIEILWHYDVDSDVEEWYFIHHAELRILPNDIEYYETYEKACEAGIKYCLENLI